MRKGSDIIGKPIVAYDTGERFSRVKDLIFDQASNRLIAFMLEEAGWFSSARVLLLQDVQAIGADALIAPSAASVVKANQVAEVKQILERHNVLKGTYIMTLDGRNLGQMVDLYFDEKTGLIDGYEVSGGMFSDAYSGRSFVPAPRTLKIGEDVAFVPSDVADLMEEQVGGIKAAMQTVSDKVQTAAQATGETLQDATTEAGQRLQKTKQAATASLTNAVVDEREQRAFVLGKAAQDEVNTPDGALLIAPGQMITASTIDVAQQTGVLDQLYRAAGGKVSQRAGEKLQLVAQDAGDRLYTNAAKAGESLQEMKRSAAQKITNGMIDPAQQKAFTLGKTAQWTVAAPHRTPLVLGGQRVTLAIAEAAEHWGVLDDLYRATGGRLTTELAQQANGVMASRVVEQAKGLRVAQTVRNREGLIVAAPGQIVTDTVINRAKTHHQERALLDAVGLTTGEAIRSITDNRLTLAGDRLNTTTQDMGAQVSHGTEQIRTSARNLLSQIKETATELQERSAHTLEEQRIRGALGRPVTRVILDPYDNVILNVGELITHQAIDSARRAGILDALLNSVYTQSPQFSKEELRAPEAGSAALKPLPPKM